VESKSIQRKYFLLKIKYIFLRDSYACPRLIFIFDNDQAKINSAVESSESQEATKKSHDIVPILDHRIAYRYGTLLLSLMRRLPPGGYPPRGPPTPYITTKTTDRWTTIGNEGKSDLYVVAREGWKDR
jgi:hypothetical protein